MKDFLIFRLYHAWGGVKYDTLSLCVSSRKKEKIHECVMSQEPL